MQAMLVENACSLTLVKMMSRWHPGDCDLAPVKGSWYREPDYAPSASGHLQLQPRACGTVCDPLSLQSAHSRLSKDNWKVFFFRTHVWDLLFPYGL